MATPRHPLPVMTPGFSLVEILVTLMLLSIGLLGLARLQARAAITGIEAYQRTQALLVAQDMASRIAANKPDALRYIADDYGAGVATACPAEPGFERDACLWSNELRGESERIDGTAAGAMAGGRGCIAATDATALAVVVVWQGLVPTSAPAVECGRDRYGDDALRRAIVVPVHLAILAGP